MSSPVTLPSGTVIGGHYIVGDVINSGGFGSVYRGVDTSEGNRLCAIKETYDVTPVARRQALMEASVLFTVRSPHLPEVYDALEFNGRFYLVMQLIEGQNLLQLLRSRMPGQQANLVGSCTALPPGTGPCTEQEVLTWLLPIIDILQELHSRNPPIIHRDIKPGNILLTPQGTTVLVDFGLTRLYDPTRITQTMVKAVSVGFSPLEQYTGKTSPQSDIYSMAATMYLLLTNCLPPAPLQRSMQDELRPPRQLNPSLSPKIERVLLKALSLYTEDRYQSMREFAQALREPAFTGYADQTISAPVSAFQAPTVRAVSAPPAMPASSSPSYPAQQYPVLPGSQPNLAAIQTLQGNTVPPSPAGKPGHPVPDGAYPLLPASPHQQPARRKESSPSHPPVLRNRRPQQPRAAMQPARSAPNASNQGCLWGLLQGVVAGLLVLSMKQEVSFYLATLLGFLFYLLAGFNTTRRGGSTWRAGWSGYYTGIVGTLVFWVTLLIGLGIGFSQRMNALLASSQNLHDHPNQAAQQAWADVQPLWPQLHILPQQPAIVNVLALMAGGVVVAWVCGWIGGMLGSSHYHDWQERMRQRSEYGM